MKRGHSLRFALVMIGMSSCTATESVKPPEIQDLRLEIARCPVHELPLIESSTHVDMERGSYAGAYFKIRAELFPCAFDDPEGNGLPALVTYCPKCRAAKRQFLEDGHHFDWIEMHELGLEKGFEKLEKFIEDQREKLDQNYPPPAKKTTSTD